MYRCLQLASYGKGFVAPNPLVGSVIVYKNQIIGEGYHRKHGEAHAEVNAISSVKKTELLKSSTLYVNLEPCSHFGKTPPCSDLIIEKQIPRVVIAHQDPFSDVSGRGIEKLQKAGIEVKVGILETEARELNKRFLIFLERKRPYIILKWAQSIDGYLDKKRKTADEKAMKFSTGFTQMLVHRLRAEEAAIMVGKNTERLDHPQLNVRFWYGNDPIKKVSDTKVPLREQLTKMYEDRIQSLIVEGGGELLSSFVNSGLWDEARVEIAGVTLGAGIKAPNIGGRLHKVLKCENYILFYNNLF